MSDERTILSFENDKPNDELVRRAGWNVSQSIGRYCVAWKGREEVVLVWRNGGWYPIAGDYREAC